VDLSGGKNAVDATSLGLSGTNVLGGGVEMTGNSVDLSNTATSFLAGSKSQTFTFNVMSNGTAQSITATLSGGANGISGSTAVSDLNSDLSNYGITASIGSDGGLQFSGATAFTASVAAASGGNAVATSGATAVNTSNYDFEGGAYAAPTSAETLTLSTGSGTTTYTVNAGDTLATTIAGLNTQLKNAGLDINAVTNAAGTGISLQSGSNFSLSDSAGSSATTFATALNANGSYDVAAPSSSSTSNAQAAINAITQAIQNLGLVQGSVGAGENKLQYAMNLANSQITNYSTAESGIRDANVAQEAANLTQGQVQQQASIAAMAQANSEPQAVLKLLQG
jgi:flagellin